MKRSLRILMMAAFAAAMVSCQKSVYDPAKDHDNNGGSGTDKIEYTVDKNGYATYEYEGFTYKFKKEVIKEDDAIKAMKKIKSDIDFINKNLPESMLKIVKTQPIWLEKNNQKNSSAAWCHTYQGNGLTYGGLAEKDFCVEITNYKYYVDWSNQNQPLMVLHELCHLYHCLGLGGASNQDINSAYNNAVNKGLYKTYYYRTSLSDLKGTEYQESGSNKCYCMTNAWEFFAEMCEAYWGENDYYPFNYAQLRDFDPVAFALMEKIWGKRFADEK